MNNYLYVDMYIKECQQQFLNNARRYHKVKAVDKSGTYLSSFLSIFMWLSKNR